MEQERISRPGPVTEVARRAHDLLHVEGYTSDECLLCVIAEVRTGVEQTWARVEEYVPTGGPEDVISGILARGAGRRSDVLDEIEAGTIEVVEVRRSPGLGLSLRYRVAVR